MFANMERSNRAPESHPHRPSGPACALQSSFRRLQRLVCSLDHQRPNDEIFDVLRRMARRDALARTIDDILADDVHCAYLAAKSYHHCNNFEKVVLRQSRRPEFKVRLHIWWDGVLSDPTHESDIHNHNWPFASCIVSGEFSNQLFDVAASGEELYHYRYDPRADKEVFELRLMGKKPIKRKETISLKPRDTYYMPATDLHRFFPTTASLSSTLIIQLPRDRNRSDVFKDAPIADDLTVDVESPALSTTEFRATLMRYRAFLDVKST